MGSDLALLYLKTRKKLKSAQIGKTPAQDNLKVSVYGWGAREHDFPTRIQTGTINVFPDSFCKSLYSLDFSEDSMFCGLGGKSGTIATDACQGDSGGPVYYNRKLIGLTSFGAGCGVSPGVYADVVQLKNWPLEKSGERPHIGKRLIKKARPGPDRPLASEPSPSAWFSFGVTKKTDPNGRQATVYDFFINGSGPISNPHVQLSGVGEICIANGSCYKENQQIPLQIGVGGRSAEAYGTSLDGCFSNIVLKVEIKNKWLVFNFNDTCNINSPKNSFKKTQLVKPKIGK